MNISQIARTIEKFTVDNSPLILTAVGVAGTLTTAVLVGKATVKATRILDEAEPSLWVDQNTPPTLLSRVRLVWPLFIPPLGVAAVTVTSIICANRIGTRRAAAMAAAFTISEKAFEEYRDKVVDRMGVNKEREVRDDISNDHVKANPISTAQVIITDNGEVPFLDDYTGRYFKSTMEDVKFAINKVNNQINHSMYASLNDLYNALGLPNIPLGEEVGWRDSLVEPKFTTSVTDENRPCFVLKFHVEPVRNYFRAH